MALEFRTLALQSGDVIKCSLIRNNALYNKVMNLYTSGSNEFRLVTNAERFHDIVSWCLGENLNSYIFNYNASSEDSFSQNAKILLSNVRTNNINNPSFPSAGSMTTNGLLNNKLTYMSSGSTSFMCETQTRYDSNWWSGLHYPYSIYGSLTASGWSNGGYFRIPLLGDLDLNGYAIYLTIYYNYNVGTFFYQNWNLTVTMCDERESWMSVIGKHSTAEYKEALLGMYEGYTPDVNDPYNGGGYSGSGGGDPHKQNWSDDSDIVLPSPMPSETDYGAVACGLITIFTPTKAQLKKLSEVIWGQGFWNFVQNAIENISDLFVSLAMVPFTVTAAETVEVTWFSFDVGGQVPIGTGIMLTKAANQWYEFDMGTINLTGQGSGFATDSVLDYSPFSKLGIYLPFIGYQELDIDECRESPINLLYRIDILSGTTVALITINGRTIYQFTGNCLTQLPLTSMDAQTMLSNAVNIGIAAASAGATAAVASAGDAMTAENLAKENISATAAELQNAQHAASVSNAQGSLTSATANGILGMKPNFKKSGAVSASASLFNVMQPYLFLTTPRQSMPEGYQRVCGFPCNMGGTLGSFSGFTVVEEIRLNGLVATSPEVEEIYQLLKSGVII